MVNARELDVACARNMVGHIAGALNAGDAIAGTMNDQRWDANDRQDMPSIGVAEHAHESREPGRTHGEALEAGPRLPEGIVGRKTRREDVGTEPLTPGVLDPLDELLQELRWHSDWVVRGAHGSGKRTVQNEGAGSLRVSRGEHHAQRATLGESKESRSLRTRSVHDDAEIVHPLFERRQLGHAVREAGASPVEQDEP